MDYFEVLKAKHGLPVSDAYTALLGKKLQGGGYPVTEIFGQLPFSFLSRGASISEWTLYGKTSQNGTPTPTAPIPVQGVGDLVESGEYSGQYAVEITNNGNTVATLYTDKPLYGAGTNLDYLQRLADGTGVKHMACGVYVLTGEETWHLNEANNVFNTLIRDAMSLANNITLACTHYKAVGNKSLYADLGNNEVCIRADNPYLWIKDTDYNTVADFQNYLAAQYATGTPVTVVYQLATPTDTPVTLPEIPTAVGTNTLDTDTAVHGDARIKGRIQRI